MSAVRLDGGALGRKIRQSLVSRAAAMRKTLGREVKLAVVTSHPDASAEAYLQVKLKACHEIGIATSVEALSASTSQKELLGTIGLLSQDKSVDAVIVELPLPRQIDTIAALAALPPSKDAEGLHPENYGRLYAARTYEDIQARKLVAPCTALAVAELLRETRAPLAGKRAVVLGRSNILGKPAAHLLSCLNLTVTLCHSQTLSIEDEVRRADVVVACIGKPRHVKGSWIKKGAIVIDAGVNHDEAGLCGDVEFVEAEKVAGFITPVPGGVGPVTTAMLLANTVLLAEKKA
jgi:methylenetetrahydrofolate dehydrogenase (NADP+)/methenyltetrahydrofolate cyclohydrolase